MEDILPDIGGEDYYAVLGVSRDADDAEIKRSFKKLALKLHPDKNTAEDAADRFQAVRKAHDVLSDPVKRRIYDATFYEEQFGWGVPMGFSGPNSRTSSSGSFSTAAAAAAQSGQEFSVDDHRYSTGYAGPRRPSASSFGVPGGAYRQSSFSRRDPPPFPFQSSSSATDGPWRPPQSSHPPPQYPQYPPSSGTSAPEPPFAGAAPPHAPNNNNNNNSSSRSSHNPHHSSTAQKPPDLVREVHCTLEELFAGFKKRFKLSKIIESDYGPVRQETTVLTVQGQPGWRDGTKVKFVGAGDRLDGMDAQDIVVVIRTKPHPHFVRRGNDLVANVRVPLFNALYGHTAFVEMIDGKKLSLPLFSIKPGMVISIPGEGMPVPGKEGLLDSRGEAAGDGGGTQRRRRGDLLIQFEIELPEIADPRSRPRLTAQHGPLDWRRVPMRCVRCGEEFTELGNAANSCNTHPGEPQGPSEALQRWSCCSRRVLPPTPGCMAQGRHGVDEAAVAAAKQQAAFNGVCAAAAQGDVYFCARRLLECGDMDMLKPCSLAARSGQFFTLLLLVRAGADLSCYEGPAEALSRAAQQQKQFADLLCAALANEPELTEVFVQVACAPKVAFAEAGRLNHTRLARDLLTHPRVGPMRCGVDEQRGVVNHLLICCAASGDVECARLLLEELHAKVDHQELRKGRTPLHWACQRLDLALMELLLNHGARTTARDAVGRRPLDVLLEAQASGPRQADGDVDEFYGSDCLAMLSVACMEEALQSMAGMSVLKVLRDEAGINGGLEGVERRRGSDEGKAGGREEERAGVEEDGRAALRPAARLRPLLFILEQALRDICEFTDALELPCEYYSCEARVIINTALASYETWCERVRESECAWEPERADAAKIAVSTVLAAGVLVKAKLQEEMAASEEDEGRARARSVGGGGGVARLLSRAARTPSLSRKRTASGSASGSGEAAAQRQTQEEVPPAPRSAGVAGANIRSV